MLNSDFGTFYWSGTGNIEILSDKINNWVQDETNFITLPAGRYILGYKAHVQADSSVYIDTSIDTHDSDLPLYEKTMNMPVSCRDNVVFRSVNNVLSFNYLYGYVASDLKLSDYPKDTRNIIPLEASDNSLGNLIELSDDKKWIVFKRNGRVRFNGCLSISWNNDFYLQVSVCRESNDSKGTPVPVVGVSIRSPLNQDNTFVYVDRVLRVKEGERLCFAFIIPNWCDTTGGFISRNSDRASSGLMANYVSFNDEKYA